MTELEVSKLEIAREYLDAAIEFFLARKNHFCAIHLAAAAEELFGAHLPKSQRIFTLVSKAMKAFMSETRLIPIDDKEARNSVNKWKNELKHMNDRACRTVTIDPAFVAEHHIELALINFDFRWPVQDYSQGSHRHSARILPVVRGGGTVPC